MNRPISRREDAMDKAAVARVLALAASFDQRTASKADVEAWWQVAIAYGWRPDWAARVVIEHYGENTDRRIMPGHITQRVREQQAKFRSTYQRQPIPDHVPETDEATWEDARLADHIDRCMTAWAAGESGGAR